MDDFWITRDCLIADRVDYSHLSAWVEAEDWSAMADVIPGMGRALWVLTTISILLNMLPIFLERSRDKRIS